MQKKVDIKSILNAIYESDKSQKYCIIQYQESEVANSSVIQKIEKEFGSVDKYIEYLRNESPEVNTHIYLKQNKLPSLIKKNGYIFDGKSKQSFFTSRENELLKMKIAFYKKIKNNILLVGKPGVGKTSLVEQFAIENNLNNIFFVECAKLLGNCEYRGSFEQKVVDLLDYAKENNLIIFFDEIHSLIDLGKSVGGISITDILKPYLLDSKLIFIGATTETEVKYLIKDDAFKRRFSILKVAEPSIETLRNIKVNFEEKVLKNTIIENSETDFVIQQLKENLEEQFFPDKLIDFLDYCNSFREITNKKVNVKSLLEEYIHEQKGNIFNS